MFMKKMCDKISKLILTLMLVISLIGNYISVNIYATNQKDIISENRESRNTDGIASGISGTSNWRIDSEGTLFIGAGYLGASNGANSMWHVWRAMITKIVFEDIVIANEDSSVLFNDLYLVTSIEGFDLFDTSNVTNMSYMFYQMRALTELDLSSFDTSNVTNMAHMFMYMSNLERLNLANFNTQKVTSMVSMFDRARNLKELTLGEAFRFNNVQNVRLPSISTSANPNYTGYWQNVGDGRINNPLGDVVFTSEELLTQYSGTMADTYVWQPTVVARHLTTKVQIFGTGDAFASAIENVHFGDVVTLTAIESGDEIFKGWLVVEGNIILSNYTDYSVTFVNNGEDVEVIAVFGDVNGSLIGEYLYTSDDIELNLSDVINWEMSGTLTNEIINRSDVRRYNILNGTTYEKYSNVFFNQIAIEAGRYVANFSVDSIENPVVSTFSIVTVIDDIAPIITTTKVEIEVENGTQAPTSWGNIFGISAMDETDGDITTDIIYNLNIEDIDMSVPAIHIITVTVSDSAENIATKDLRFKVMPNKYTTEVWIFDNGNIEKHTMNYYSGDRAGFGISPRLDKIIISREVVQGTVVFLGSAVWDLGLIDFEQPDEDVIILIVFAPEDNIFDFPFLYSVDDFEINLSDVINGYNDEILIEKSNLTIMKVIDATLIQEGIVVEDIDLSKGGQYTITFIYNPNISTYNLDINELLVITTQVIVIDDIAPIITANKTICHLSSGSRLPTSWTTLFETMAIDETDGNITENIMYNLDITEIDMNIPTTYTIVATVVDGVGNRDQIGLTLVVDEPVIDEPVIDEPVIDEPVIDEPVIDEPVIDKPVIDKPEIDEPVIDKPVIDEPEIDKPVIDEPVIDKPVIDEPVIDEPVIDEPVIDEPVIDEPEIDKPVIDESVEESTKIITLPNTGDRTNLFALCGFLVISLGSILLVIRKRNSTDNS